MHTVDSVMSQAGISVKWDVQGDPDVCAELGCDTVSDRTLSRGLSFTLWSTGQGRFLGVSGIGRPGVPAEKIGRDAAVSFLGELGSGATVDVHTADQVLIYMALGRILSNTPSSVTASELTGHTLTTMSLIERMTGVPFHRRKEGELRRISVD